MLDNTIEDRINDTHFLYDLVHKNFKISFYYSDKEWCRFLEQNKNDLFFIIKTTLNHITIQQNQDRTDCIDAHFTNNDIIHNLNKKYRLTDKPTNVLSFPTYSSEELVDSDYNYGNQQFFGDIFIAYQYCYEESQKINFSFYEHIAHMIVHDILHIFGYDHIEQNEAEIMETFEILILKQCQINSPYQ